MSFRTLAFNASYIIINWKPLSSRLDPDWIFLYQGPKNVIRFLIANLWNGLVLLRDEEKSSINQQFSSNQALAGEKGLSAQSGDQKYEGFFLSSW